MCDRAAKVREVLAAVLGRVAGKRAGWVVVGWEAEGGSQPGAKLDDAIVLSWQNTKRKDTSIVVATCLCNDLQPSLLLHGFSSMMLSPSQDQAMWDSFVRRHEEEAVAATAFQVVSAPKAQASSLPQPPGVANDTMSRSYGREPQIFVHCAHGESAPPLPDGNPSLPIFGTSKRKIAR